MNYKTFKPGDKVRNRYGFELTVTFQDGCQVFVEEEHNRWYHPSNLYKIDS